mmetsp:Transcript_36777/g.80644  ORF Transcript_36777/g.80644 Transcript_36777/m.80644 type:complete len:335 (-) Transcript_36777:110-1114(-)
MPKKPVAKAKAKVKTEAELKAEAEAEEEAKAKAEARRIWQQRKDASKWTQAQLDALVSQRKEAAVKGIAWLEEPHKWHEEQLKKLLKSFELKLLDAAPDDLRTGVDLYVAQCAGGIPEQQETFRDDREMYACLPELPNDGPYVRATQSPEAVAAAEQVSGWTDSSPIGMSKFIATLQAHSTSAAVQEAGMTRIGLLLSEAKDEALRPGFQAELLMPGITAAMRDWIQDPAVQQRGCAALRGIALTKQISAMCELGASRLLAEALRVHLKIPDVVLSATGAVWAMSQVAGKNSPELAYICEAGVVEILQKAMVYHAFDQTLVGKIRVVLPFLVLE